MGWRPSRRPTRSVIDSRMDLSERIKRRIEEQGAITYEEFVGFLLYDEDWGYYRAGKREGRDYLTSPEIHPAFGRVLGRYFDGLARSLGGGPFSILELGGAGGGLARQIIPYLDASLLTRYIIVEKGRRRPEGPIEWAEDLSALPPLQGLTFVVANEFFDALPFHRVVNRGGMLREIYVGFDHGFFEMAADPVPSVTAFLETFPLVLDEGGTGEVTTAMAPIVADLSDLLDRAVLLLFDYGYHWEDIAWGRFPEGTMVGYRNMVMQENIFDSLGTMDVTHHVNFDHLSALLGRNGWTGVGEIEQYRFLINIGILGILIGLDEGERMAAKSIIDPHGIGSVMRVLGFTKNIDMPVPGFRGAPPPL